MQIGLILVAIVLFAFAGLDGYQAATGKRIVEPPVTEGEALPPVDEAMRRKWWIAAAVAAVLGVALVVLAFV